MLTEKTAKVEEKPEVRKAGGVYYTPSHIVDYIVDNTIGRLLEGKTPDEAAALRALDPACGSGSFLLGAYQKVLDWHLDYYHHHDPEGLARKKNPPIRQIAATAADPALFGNPSYRLTISERKRILLNNIHGVDVDPQAVEVTKLSLLLKCLEGESSESVQSVLKFMRERALPDLDGNIKCGNSLIAPDFHDPARFPGNHDLSEEARRRINAFDWSQAFPKIMKSGGFDAVIGNPPYLFITELDERQKQYFAATYATCQYRFDVYGLFIEQAISRQLRNAGVVSVITPHTLLSNDSFEKLRRLLLGETALTHLVDIGPGVFPGAKNETMIFIAVKSPHDDASSRCRVIHTTAATFPSPVREFTVRPGLWAQSPRRLGDSPIRRGGRDHRQDVGIRAPLGEICTINQGLRTGDNARYLSPRRRSSLWRHAVGGKDVGRYEPLRNGTYVYYNPDVLDAPRDPAIFESREKIVVQEIRNITLARRIVATYDNRRFYCLQSTNVINLRTTALDRWPLLYVLGILNSALVNFFFRQSFPGNNHIASNQLAQIPIAAPAPMSSKQLVALVTSILGTHRKLAAARLATDKDRLKREIAATDQQIDRLVYDLYGLTEDEIKVIDDATQS